MRAKKALLAFSFVLILAGGCGESSYYRQNTHSASNSLSTEPALSAAVPEPEGRRIRSLKGGLRGRQKCRGPNLWLDPKSGPIGTRVTFTGDCFVGRMYGTSERALGGYGIFLIRQLAETPGYSECEQIVGLAPLALRIERNGRARGHFTVGKEGRCFQNGNGIRPVVPGPYRVGLGSHASTTGAWFRVTP